jgi:uncharacterized protein YkwD
LSQQLPGTATLGGGAIPATAGGPATLQSLSATLSQLRQAIGALGAPPVTGGTYVAGQSGTAATNAQGMAILPAATLLQSAAGTEDHPFEQRVLDLINQQRAQYGLRPVSYNAQLDSAARGHTAQMGATRSMAHEGIGDGDPGSRIRSAGFGGAWGENVAVGQSSPEQVVAEWMASPEHRKNILDPNFTQLGVEVGTGADGRQYWAQEFGA